jgi:hypothetical protein
MRGDEKYGSRDRKIRGDRKTNSGRGKRIRGDGKEGKTGKGKDEVIVKQTQGTGNG